MNEETLYEGPVSEETDALKTTADTDDLAVIKLGISYMNGDGVPQDYDEALKWLRKSDSSLAYYTAAQIYIEKEEWANAVEELKKGLDSEDSTATGYCFLQLGKLYLSGKNETGEPDPAAAIEYLEQGLDLEPAESMEYAGYLGLAYHAEDEPYDAIHWYRIAIEEYGQDMYKEKLYQLYRTGVVGREKKEEAEAYYAE